MAAFADAAGIAELIRGGFSDSVLGTTIYGCSGIGRYIGDHIRAGVRSPNRYWVVEGSDGTLVGAAEFRISDGTLFLSYIATDPAARGGGVGSGILRDAVAASRAEGARRLALDVFTSNAVASRWYERLGMAVESERTTYSAGPQLEPPPSFQVPDLPQADAVHARFGFSEISIAVGTRAYRVGRIGSRYFRLVGDELGSADGLRAALGSLDSSRRLLIIADPGSLRPVGDVVVVSRRMGAAFVDLHL